LFLTFAGGATFVLMQINEYNHLSHEGLTLHSSMFGSAFYVLTGFHGFHVFLGVCWLAWAFFKALNGHFTKENYIGIEVLGLYWHFVDVVWVLLFTLIYLM
jgi:heme/copper-type cytochrome/quinol oxidase subunit 3